MQWLYEQESIDWTELSELYRIAPLGTKRPDDLKRAFSNSMYKCFVLSDGALVGAGRAVADGVDCSYLCDIAVHPKFQGNGLGKAIIIELKKKSAHHSTTKEDPAMSMSNASIPVFEIGLNALSAILDKAETYAAAKSIDPTVLLSARLFPDMFAFTRQVQSACDQAKNGGARLAGIDPPRYEDNEKTIAELKARIAKTVAFVKTLDARKIDASTDREITFPLGPNNKGHMKGADYLNHFALPNFYFHLTTAYDILRHCGVEIGKRDFAGAIPIRIT